MCKANTGKPSPINGMLPINGFDTQNFAVLNRALDRCETTTREGDRRERVKTTRHGVSIAVSEVRVPHISCNFVDGAVYDRIRPSSLSCAKSLLHFKN